MTFAVAVLLVLSQTSQLTISAAEPDPSGQTITIKGQNFGSRPFVTFDLIPLMLQYATDTQIVAAAPIVMMPPGEYLLTVSRGPSAAESASEVVTLGGAERSRRDAAKASLGAGLPPLTPADAPAARVGDHVITVAEVDREWRRTDPTGYLGIARDVFEARRRAADRLVADELIAREAKARGMTTEDLLKEEIPKRIVEMPESAVQALYESLGDSTRGASLEQMRPAIRAWLKRNSEPELAKMSYVEELMRVSTRGEVLLAPPRIQVEQAAQDAALGPASAPIEIVAFGDLQSAGYARFARLFGRVRDTYGDRVRIVFKHMPVTGPDAFAAAEAAQCANARGRFWPFHDALVAQSGPIGITRLHEAAVKAGLERKRFDACVEQGESRGIIRQAVDEAARYDIHEAPSFMINGRRVADPPSFLPPFEFFQRIIEEELSTLSRR